MDADLLLLETDAGTEVRSHCSVQAGREDDVTGTSLNVEVPA